MIPEPSLAHSQQEEDTISVDDIVDWLRAEEHWQLVGHVPLRYTSR
jgi:hypothetical protein